MGNQAKVRLLQILKAWELFVKVLGKE